MRLYFDFVIAFLVIPILNDGASARATSSFQKEEDYVEEKGEGSGAGLDDRV